MGKAALAVIVVAGLAWSFVNYRVNRALAAAEAFCAPLAIGSGIASVVAGADAANIRHILAKGESIAALSIKDDSAGDAAQPGIRDDLTTTGELHVFFFPGFVYTNAQCEVGALAGKVVAKKSGFTPD